MANIVTPSVAAASGAPSAAAAASAVPNGDGTEDRFMKLLVAQMRNQDPLNPLDNAQVTSQLAQINTVRGIEDMNQSLKKLLQRDQGFNPAQAAGLVGRQVWVEGQSLALDAQAGARGGFELAAAAESVKVEISDARGLVVDTLELGKQAPGFHAFEWDGVVGGRSLPPGAYTMRVSASAGKQALEVVTMNAATVRSVLRGPDGVALEFGGGRRVAMEQVRGVL